MGSMEKPEGDEEIQKNMTDLVIKRRAGTYAKQWCEMVRNVKYDITSLLSNLS